MSLAILGIGSATPAREISQAAAADLAVGFANAAPGHERTLAAIYRQTRIRARGSVLLEDPAGKPFAQSFFPPAGAVPFGGPSTSARMARYAAEAGPLALAAAHTALARSSVEAADVTHLVTCSCTGFANPGVDLDIVRGLGLAADVSRTHVGFMGCHGAFNALRVAEAFATAHASAVVLVVCVELCSLHFQYGSRSDAVVANSIFADGAAALVGVGPDHPLAGGADWQLDRQWSRLLPDSEGEMGWVIGDHGFEMSLSARVPGIIHREIAALVAAALGDEGLASGDIHSWAVHPGGPRVLANVRDALGLDEAALSASHDVLAAHGNMSSATILFILERMLPEGMGPCVAMAFGPGLTAEVALLRRAAGCR
jgi:predicted naringenin-chalcone synthase